MGPLRDELVKCAKELDPQPIINLITPETVRTYVKIPLKDLLNPFPEVTVGRTETVRTYVKIPLKDLLNPFPEVTVGRTIKTFKNCINKE